LLNGFSNFAEREIVFYQFVGVNFYLKLCGDTAKTSYIGNTLNLFEAGDNHPAVQFGQFP